MGQYGACSLSGLTVHLAQLKGTFITISRLHAACRRARVHFHMPPCPFQCVGGWAVLADRNTVTCRHHTVLFLAHLTLNCGDELVNLYNSVHRPSVQCHFTYFYNYQLIFIPVVFTCTTGHCSSKLFFFIICTVFAILTEMQKILKL